jgi:Holliday junction resolvasome RuvABC endonuclease subunit
MILTFDCATQTGWCAGDGSDLPILGTVNLPSGVEAEEFLDFWDRWLNRHFAEINPTRVVYEAPILQGISNMHTAEKLIGLSNFLVVNCYRRKIPVEKVMPTQVKKYLTGDGKAEKPDMMRVARRCGVSPKNYDEADAFGSWLLALSYHAREHQPRWDAAIFQPGPLT